MELFGDIRINNFNFNVVSMTDICYIIDGDRGKNYPKQEELLNDGYCLFLNAKNVTKNGFVFKSCTYVTKEKDDALHNGKLCRGDIVLTTRGTIGNIALYDDKVLYDNIRINSGMVILRIRCEKIVDKFFVEQFKMQLNFIKENITSGSAQPQLPVSVMNKICMVLPPIELQNKFADFVTQTDKSKYCQEKCFKFLRYLAKNMRQELL